MRAALSAPVLLLAPGLLLALGHAAAAPTLADAERQRAADARAGAQAAVAARGAAEAETRAAQARVDGAARLREAETHLADLTARLNALEAQRADAERQLKAAAAGLSPMLPVIERLAAYPAETVLAVKLAPDDAVRGLLVLRHLASGIGAEAAGLREREAALASAEAAIAAALPGVRAAQAAQATQSAQLDAQLAAARQSHVAADAAATEAAARAASSAAQAETLRGLLAQMEAERRAAEAQALADAKEATRQKRDADAAALRQRRDQLAQPAGPGVAESQLVVPVVGTLRRSWGDPTDAGRSNGISYAALPGARVVSPCAGRVAFAGPFRSFGQLVIVDCGGGYHAVLAGAGRTDVTPGRAVLAGEPVAVMGDGQPSLYVELRRGGQPVNPAPFLKGRPAPSSS